MTNISNIHVLPIDGRNNCVAVVSFTLFNAINITGVKLHTTKSGSKYITYPINPGSKRHSHYVYPINEQLRTDIVDAIWSAYLAEISKNEETSTN